MTTLLHTTKAAASTHDVALSDARAVLADMPHHTDAQILTACAVLETYGGRDERVEAAKARNMIERTSA